MLSLYSMMDLLIVLYSWIVDKQQPSYSEMVVIDDLLPMSMLMMMKADLNELDHFDDDHHYGHDEDLQFVLDFVHSDVDDVHHLKPVAVAAVVVVLVHDSV